MELERYNPNTLLSRRVGKPALSLNCKVGCFNINKVLANHMAVNIGDGVEIAFDKKQDQFFIAKSILGFKTRHCSSGLVFSSKKTAVNMVNKLKLKVVHVSMPVGISPVEQDGLLWFPIFTITTNK